MNLSFQQKAHNYKDLPRQKDISYNTILKRMKPPSAWPDRSERASSWWSQVIFSSLYGRLHALWGR